MSQQTIVSITPAVLKHRKTEYSTTLQPQSESPLEEEAEEEEVEEKYAPAQKDTAQEEKADEKPAFKSSPALLNVPARPGYQTADTEQGEEEEFRPVSNRPTVKQNQAPSDDIQVQTTEKTPEQNSVDINENEYDVTLNEALNPTLPNLPIRSFPTGFSSSSDLNFRSLQRPRYVSPGLARESSDYSYQTKPAPQSQRYEAVPVYNSGGSQFANTNADYSGQFSHISPSYRQSPRITQARFYSSY